MTKYLNAPLEPGIVFTFVAQASAFFYPHTLNSGEVDGSDPLHLAETMCEVNYFEEDDEG